jgi:hypothetical protein
MSLTRKKTAELNLSVTAQAANRARAASTVAAANAANAAQNAALAAQNAAGVAQAALKDGVYSARSWAAPRIEGAADYCTATVAPKVSSALRTTARQVSPADTTSSKRSSMLTWSLLGAAVVAAAGAAAVMVRYRYRTAIAADSETVDEEVMADSADGQEAPASPEETRSAAPMPTEQGTEASVNGRVTTPGW